MKLTKQTLRKMIKEEMLNEVLSIEDHKRKMVEDGVYDIEDGFKLAIRGMKKIWETQMSGNNRNKIIKDLQKLEKDFEKIEKLIHKELYPG
jgi:hypothetical protein